MERRSSVSHNDNSSHGRRDSILGDDIITLQTSSSNTFLDAYPDLKLITTLRWSPLQDQQKPFVSELRQDEPKISQASLMNLNDLLPYHLNRLVNSAKDLGFTTAYNTLKSKDSPDLRSSLRLLLSVIRSSITNPTILHRIRITIDRHGTIAATSTPLDEPTPFILVPNPTLPGPEQFFHSTTTNPPTCTLYLSTQPFTLSFLTTHKTTHRTPYNTARASLGIESSRPKSAEVLLCNTRSEVMEASLSSVYFLRDGKWLTPHLSTGCNAGVMRNFALTYGYCVEDIITVDKLVDQEIVWLSNAVRGFWLAKMELRMPISEN